MKTPTPPRLLDKLITTTNINNELLPILNQHDTPPTPFSPPSSTITPLYKVLPHIEGLTPKLINIFKGDNIKFAKTIPNKLKQIYSRLKTPVPKEQTSNIVYKVDCKDCNSCYIGQTSRSLKGRLTSHKSDCRRGVRSCALSEHVISKDHRIDFDDAQIVFRQGNYYKRRFLEMVAIIGCDDSMNKRSDVDDLSVIYSYVLSLSKKSYHTNR